MPWNGHSAIRRHNLRELKEVFTNFYAEKHRNYGTIIHSSAANAEQRD